MGSRPEISDRELEMDPTRGMHAGRGSPTVTGTKRKADSNDFAAVGCQFSQGKIPYPPNIDLPEEEQIARSPPPPPTRALSFPPPHSTASYSPVASSVARKKSLPLLLYPGPYLQPSDFERLRPPKHRKRDHEKGTTSSVQSSDRTSSDRGPSTATQDDDEDEGGHGDRGTTPTPIGPTTTPSLPSIASTDEDETRNENGPSSPHPFSAYNTYNPRASESAVKSIEAQVAWNKNSSKGPAHP